MTPDIASRLRELLDVADDDYAAEMSEAASSGERVDLWQRDIDVSLDLLREIADALDEIESLRRDLKAERQFAKDIENSILSCEKGQTINDVLANYRTVRRTIQAIRETAA